MNLLYVLLMFTFFRKTFGLTNKPKMCFLDISLWGYGGSLWRYRLSNAKLEQRKAKPNVQHTEEKTRLTKNIPMQKNTLTYTPVCSLLFCIFAENLFLWSRALSLFCSSRRTGNENVELESNSVDSQRSTKLRFLSDRAFLIFEMNEAKRPKQTKTVDHCKFGECWKASL